MPTSLLRFRASAALTCLAAALSGRVAAQEPLKFPFMSQTPVDSPKQFFHPDLNADGRDDLVVLRDGNTLPVAVFLSTGPSGFGSPSFFATSPVPSSSFAINLADFNNDGKLDFVASNPQAIQQYRLCVGRGNGAGGFAAPIAIVNSLNGPLGGELVIGDLNEDGIEDIVSVDGGNSWFHRILSNSILNYTSSIVALPKGQITASLIDVTGDGKLDLVGISNLFGLPQSTSYWSSHAGLGNGNFGPPQDLTLPKPTNWGVIGDINGDGNIDALIAPFGFPTPYQYEVVLGAGGGNFILGVPVDIGTSSLGFFVLADVNHDAAPDLVQTENIKAGVKLGDGAGGFGAYNSFYASLSLTGIGAADFIGDGNVDIVLSSMSFDYVGVLEGDGTGRFISGSLLSNGGKAATIGDLNQDGWPDLAMIGFAVTLATGAGAGAVNEPQDIASGITNPRDITSADFDRDGILDLATLTNTNGLTVYRGMGAGAFAAPVHLTAIPNPSRVAAGELNQDGVPDLVISGQNAACVLLSIGGGAFAAPNVLQYPGSTPSSTVELGDFDEDGLLDFIAGTIQQQKLLWFRATGGGAFAAPVPIYTTADIDFIPPSVEVVDVNQDDHLDLLIANPGDGDVRYAFGDGQGGFSGFAIIGFTGQDLIAAGDLNGDAVPDVISRLGAQMQVRLGKTSGVFSAPYSFNHALGAPTGYWICDMSADGFADIIVAGDAWTLVAPNLRGNPAGTESFGNGTPGYRGFLGVMSNGGAFVGNSNFTLTCSNAPRFSLGALLIADVNDPAGSDFVGLGFLLHLDLTGSGVVLGFDMPTDAQGLAAAYVPIANDPSLVGLTVHAQAVFYDPVSTQAAISLISSNALSVTFQP